MGNGTVCLELLAPLSGVLVPLDLVPDPVFASRIVGDGVSIDPTSTEVLAPVAGVITQLHRAHHALTITTPDGIEVMVHVGIDTVGLNGLGFTARVQQGQAVRAGQALIGFDADLVARGARSLLTQVLIVNRDAISGPFHVTEGMALAGQSIILRVQPVPRARAADPTADGPGISSEPVVLPNPAGLHARPAAVLASAAKKFQAEIRLVRGADSANAKSVVALLALSTQRGDCVRLQASGTDAAAALAALVPLLAAGCGEDPGVAVAPPAEAAVAVVAVRSGDVRRFAGVAAAPGIAVGEVWHLRREAATFGEQGRGEATEAAALSAALAQAQTQIGRQAAQIADRQHAGIFDAHQELLADPEIVEAARLQLEGGKSAAFAWHFAYTQQAQRLAQLENPLLRERANDIRDVGQQVLALLAGEAAPAVPVPQGSVLVAEELTPSDVALFDPQRVLGFCTTGGGVSGHVAILARSLGIPAVCGIDGEVRRLGNGARAIVDGNEGFLLVDPTAAELAAAITAMSQRAAQRARDELAAVAPARTRDGHRVEVVANVRNAQEARAAVALGAEGVGLLRSEFLFDGRDAAPSEHEQAEAYLAVAQALGPERTLVIRTLDAGGDKPLAYLPMAHEDNPFLGVRGIRLSLQHPELLRAQLRAIFRVGAASRLHVMFPMITSIEELRAARKIAAEELPGGMPAPGFGVMIEVPAAAILAHVLAPEVDFFSIGTNDLTQYTLAMDRGHPSLARQADSLHPAVLRLIAMTVQAAHAQGKWVGVCGGLAAEPDALAVLVGLGVDELSVPVPAIAEVKAAIGRLQLDPCKELAQQLLAMANAAQVREFLRAARAVH